MDAVKNILLITMLAVITAVIFHLGTALHRVADETEAATHQAKLLIMSTRGLTFDVRKNLTSNVELQARIVDSLTGSMDRMSTAAARSMERAAARLERLADTLEGAACSTAAGADHVLAETAAAIRELVPASRRAIDNAADTLASARGVVEQARAELVATGVEVRQAVGGVRPVLDTTTCLLGSVDGIAQQGIGIAASARRTVEFYERKLLHPTKWERVKWLLNLLGFAASEIYVPLKISR